MNPGDRCIHYDIYGNEIGSYTIDQERQHWTIFGEGLGAILFFAVGILSLVCTFKASAPEPNNPPKNPENQRKSPVPNDQGMPLNAGLPDNGSNGDATGPGSYKSVPPNP
jgi:hypothetical protein